MPDILLKKHLMYSKEEGRPLHRLLGKCCYLIDSAEFTSICLFVKLLISPFLLLTSHHAASDTGDTNILVSTSSIFIHYCLIPPFKSSSLVAITTSSASKVLPF